MKELMAKLEAATEGSRELDEEITAAISGATLERQPDGRPAYYKATRWVSVGQTLPFTTSLDAKVPGENIVLARWDEVCKLWHAWHKSDGRTAIRGCGRTEPLARRTAGLKGLEND